MGASLSFPAEFEDFGDDSGETEEGAGAAVDKAFGGSVLAVLSSLAGIDAASGPLPATGTEPTCFDAETGETPVEAEPALKGTAEVVADEMSFVED